MDGYARNGRLIPIEERLVLPRIPWRSFTDMELEARR